MTERIKRIACAQIAAILLAGVLSSQMQAQTVGEVWPAWSAGMLDIHQINTGKGNAAFFILPDGTTLLVDAGALEAATERHVAPRPDGSRSPGEWIARYIRHLHPRGEDGNLDFALLTHFHSDHMGSVTSESPRAASGQYRLAGITEVGTRLAIKVLLDRGWPDYSFPEPLTGEMMDNYRAFLKWATTHRGLRVERFKPGLNRQIALGYAPERYPDFEIRNVVANGEVWTGVGQNTRHVFPDLEGVPREDYPPENPCSIGFRLSYGDFDYFSGGDIVGFPSPGGPAWHDVETPVAQAVGPVEVSLLNHHGFIDSQNEFFVSSLRPRVWILPVWDSAHPTPSAYSRIRSNRLYPGPRDIFATNMHPANRIVTPGLDRLASDQGHIVVRVAPGGGSFQVVVLDDSAETFRVKSIHGPYVTD